MKPSGGAPLGGTPGRDVQWLAFSADRELLAGVAPAPEVAPLVVDSWLVEDGLVRALERHERRFTDSCARLLGLPGKTVESFLAAVRVALPRTGRWFPRIEAYRGASPRLALWLRAAPPTSLRTSLWIAPGVDPREHPRVKGPDLPLLATLRERARRAGGDDALLCAADGSVLEAAHAAVVWWREQTLCLPAAEDRVLTSVTATALVDLARRSGVTIARERRLPIELGQLETWTCNALHGIRPVSGWHGSGAPERARPASERAAEWSTALARLRVAIDDVPT